MNYYMYPSDDSGIDVSELEDSVINGIQNKGTPTDGLGINDSRPDNIGKKDISKDNIGKNGFFYAPINLGRPQIRLLRILKGRNSSISCELFQALVERRDGAIPYEAISYVWGSPERERQVLINGTLFGVTRNLYQILCSLQLEDEDRIVWVDAICIDQTNEVERGHQVQHMGDVYKQAVRVIYWLGSPTYMTNWCLHSLRLLQEETKDLEIKAWTKERWMIAWKSLKSGSRHRPALACKGLEELLDRPWFRRVWILQEVANSQSAVISCGKTSVSAKIFTLAPFLMGVYPGPHRQAILDMMPGPFRGSTWFSGSRDLYTLIDHFGASETTEERDLIYALLGMSSDAVHVIHPDYQKSEDEVLNVVFHFLFQRSPHRMSRSPQSLRDFCLRVRYFQDLVMQDVAGNVVNGDALMAFSLRCHPCFSISEQTIKIAAKNRQKGSRIIQVILCHLDRRSQKPTRGQVDALIEGAAANDVCGEEVLRVFFARNTSSSPVTVSALEAATLNQVNGHKIIRLLLGRCTIHCISDQAIANALRNPVYDEEILLELLALGEQHPSDDSNGVLRELSRSDSWGRIMNFLLKNSKSGQQKPFIDKNGVIPWIQSQWREDLNSVQRAIRDKNLEIIRQLLFCNPREVSCRSAFASSCALNTSLVGLLLKHSTNVDISQESEGKSILLKASMKSIVAEIMKLLLQKVVIIKTESPSGTTHLRRAIRQNLQHLITVLHEAGAEFNIEDEKNAAPLLFAAEAGHAEIIKILMDYKRCWTFCCKSNNLVRTETSSCPNSQSNRVDTPLHQAAKDGDASVVDQLVRSGADLESRNHSHQTPLALAVEMCQVAVVRGLLHHGADPQSTLLLSLAVDSNKTEGTRLEIVRTLLLAGANIEVESAHGRTALHIAAQLGYTTIMEFLLENGAKTETEDTWGYTPMEWASRWGRRDSVQVLLAHEAKVNMGNTGEVRLPT